MAGLSIGDFDAPDEVRSPDKTRLDVVRMAEGTSAGRMTLQPGWRWSDCIRPAVGGDSCQARHVGLAQSGTLHVVHEDGTEGDIMAGHPYVIEPGHDAWVVGDEPFTAYEFENAAVESYAKS